MKRHFSSLILYLLFFTFMVPLSPVRAVERTNVGAYFASTTSATVDVGTEVTRALKLPRYAGDVRPLAGDFQTATITIITPDSSSVTVRASNGYLDESPLYSYYDCNIIDLMMDGPPLFDALRMGKTRATVGTGSNLRARVLPTIAVPGCGSTFVGTASNPFANGSGVDTSQVVYNNDGTATATGTLRLVWNQNAVDATQQIGNIRVTPDVPGTYTVRVTSVPAGGGAPASSSFTITANAVAGLGARPTNVAAVATSPTSAIVTFDDGAQKAGQPWKSFTAVSVPGGITKTLNVTFAYNSERAIQLTGLTPGTAYKFRVFATAQEPNSYRTANSLLSNSITMPAAFAPATYCAIPNSVVNNKVVEIFTLSNTGNAACKWRVPNGISSINIFGIGGGGGGGGAFLEPELGGGTFIGQGAGGGGGGGNYFAANNVSVTAGSDFFVKIGAGGAGGNYVYTDNPADAVRNQRAGNGTRGDVTYFGNGTLDYFGHGGFGGYGGGGNAFQNRPGLGGDGGGSDQFNPGLATDAYSAYSYNSCRTTPANDSTIAHWGCSFWEAGGGGIGASGLPITYTAVNAGQDGNNLGNPVGYFTRDGVKYYTASDIGGSGATGGSGSPGITSTLSGTTRYYGGGGGGGGNLSTYSCPGISGLSSGLGGLGVDGGGDAARCNSVSSPRLAQAGVANTGGGGGAGGIVTIGGTIDLASGNGASGGSGVLIITYNLPTSAPRNYTINYFGGGGVGSMASQTGLAASVVLSPNQFNLNGYYLSAWQDEFGNVYTPGSTVVIYNDITINLTAVWSKIIPVPDPKQTDEIYSIFPESGTSGTLITIKGNFLRKVVRIFVGNIEIDSQTWTQTPNSIAFKAPSRSDGIARIQIYNGAVPVLPEISFTYKTEVIVTPEIKPTPKASPLTCVKGKSIIVARAKNCPRGYQVNK